MFEKKLPAQSAFAQYALILGITEALYLDTPDYALINSYVDIVKNSSTNMLQALSMPFCAKCALPETSCKRLTAANFFPQEFYKILRSGYGNKTIRKIENAALQEPCLDLTAAKKSTPAGGRTQRNPFCPVKRYACPIADK